MAPNKVTPLGLETETAKLTIVRHVVAMLVSNHASWMWEDYPEIGEDDWIDICGRFRSAYTFPTHEELQAAYRHLAGRADH